MICDLNIWIICGGLSSEREISIRSGKTIKTALEKYGCTRTKLFILDEHNLIELLQNQIDIAFIALHGELGEDGCIQGLFEMASIPYTGSGVLSSALCMDKIKTKDLFMKHGIPTPTYSCIKKSEIESPLKLASFIGEMDGPIVLKVPTEGSSIGVEIIKDRRFLNDTIKKMMREHDELLVEAFVDGMEVSVPVVGNEHLQVLQSVEIEAENEFYDYNSKYTPGMSHHIIPPRISEAMQNRINELAITAYRVCNCKGFARVDFIISKDEQPYVIEINTIPGMTELSLVPDSVTHSGETFENFVAKIVRLGIENSRRKIDHDDF